MPERLLNGVAKFQSDVFPTLAEEFRDLANGQRPLAMFITCSDSRINPNMLTQTRPGELFVLRNAGNIVPPYSASGGGEAATIEYAIEVLKVPDIVVCGHSYCGAMRAVLEPSHSTELRHVSRWLRLAEVAKRVVESWPSEVPECDRLNAVAERNAVAQLQHLHTYPCVAAAIERRALRLHAWIYRFEAGEVVAYNTENGRFEHFPPPRIRLAAAAS